MTLIISIIIGIIIAIVSTFNSWYYYWSERVVMTILHCILGVIVGGMFGLLVSWALPMDLYEKKYSYQLESLQDGSQINGRFFLGCGTIDGEIKYVWYEGDNGVYQMQQVKHTLVKIKYTEGIATVNVTEICATDSWINDWAYDSDIGDKTYLIEVPKGTIHNNYSLDAK